ncbi:MAG: 3-oxoacyl-ACP reductase [Rhodospirillaceae bacterium]|nr:3-oxoacyl-ACP reductase [Rhodospirillaceae bacterium]|tara:strand:+ start:4894 stop:5649 length:756 start_codon:yes stop_codon:yes gene_type:complete
MTDSLRVAVVTGAGTGIGRAVALGLTDDGFHVALAGRTQEKLDAVVDGHAEPDRLMAVRCDVGDPGSVAMLFKAVEDRWGRLDLLFNNAGIGAPDVPMEDLSFEQWQRVVDTNLTGPFLCTQHAMRIMKAQTPKGGRIVNNGSISAHVPRPRSAPYTATKHAISGLTRSTSLDGRADNICCGQIDIGNALTDMTAGSGDGLEQPDGRIVPETTMDVDNVVRSIVLMANMPLDANVPFMTVMSNTMPYIGRG